LIRQEFVRGTAERGEGGIALILLGEQYVKAAVCYDFGKPLVVEEVEIDRPRWAK
jgi:hypothetical protein